MYANTRSCVGDLHAGITDGGYKKYAMHRGGQVEAASLQIRKNMSGLWHGFHETTSKCLPDGRPANAPYYLDITPADSENVQ